MMPPPRALLSSAGKPVLRMRQNKPTESLRGEDIRRLRTRLGLTQPQLAWLFAVSRSTMQGWEAADRQRCSKMSDAMRENIRIVIEEVRNDQTGELIPDIRAAVAESQRARAQFAVLAARFGDD